jgi:hypothetical protein
MLDRIVGRPLPSLVSVNNARRAWCWPIRAPLPALPITELPAARMSANRRWWCALRSVGYDGPFDFKPAGWQRSEGVPSFTAASRDRQDRRRDGQGDRPTPWRLLLKYRNDASPVLLKSRACACWAHITIGKRIEFFLRGNSGIGAGRQ